MPEHRTLTTESGAPVADNQNSQTAGAGRACAPAGPAPAREAGPLQPRAHPRAGRARPGLGGLRHLRADRRRVALHAGRGSCRGRASAPRSSSASPPSPASRGSADAVRDPRGFAVKFYTEDGNYDLVGNNTPIFFIRDPLKFPDFIHSQKPDPYTNRQEPDNVWDFFSLSPEATHMFTWLFGDRGIPRATAT